jgi:hypothetical protein
VPLQPRLWSFMNFVDQINAHKYLYLDKLFEEVDLELCILLDEARVQLDSQDSESASLYGPIVSDSTCKKYRVTFKDYIAYSVRSESFTILDDAEEFIGNLFREFSKSKFLDYVVTSTAAVEDIVGAYKHYEIACLNHIIDVATGREPLIEEITKPFAERRDLIVQNIEEARAEYARGECKRGNAEDLMKELNEDL